MEKVLGKRGIKKQSCTIKGEIEDERLDGRVQNLYTVAPMVIDRNHLTT